MRSVIVVCRMETGMRTITAFFLLMYFLQIDSNLKFGGISLSTCLVDNVQLLTVILSFLS